MYTVICYNRHTISMVYTVICYNLPDPLLVNAVLLQSPYNSNGVHCHILKTLNLLKIEDIMKTKALKLYYRYKQNELPKYFESMFTESNDNHSHDTRHKSLLYQLPTKTSTGRLCIRHYIPELLSKTPECITEKLDTHSFSGYSNYIKKLLYSEL